MPIAIYIVPRPLANSLDRNRWSFEWLSHNVRLPFGSRSKEKTVRRSFSCRFPRHCEEGELKILIKYVLNYTHLHSTRTIYLFYLFNFLQIIYFLLVKFKTKKSIPMYHVQLSGVFRAIAPLQNRIHFRWWVCSHFLLAVCFGFEFYRSSWQSILTGNFKLLCVC